MLPDCIKRWINPHGKTVIHIETAVFTCECCKPKPAAPGMPLLFHGDSFMAIKFPVSVPAGGPDVVKTIVTYTVEGQPPATVEIAGNGGDTAIVVPEASNGSLWAAYADAAGNVSAPSPTATWVNASDTVPPDAPAGAPTLGAGDTV